MTLRLLALLAGAAALVAVLFLARGASAHTLGNFAVTVGDALGD